MNLISAFADEIDDDLDEQIRVLQRHRVDNIELRGVWGKNVLALSADEVREVKRRATDHGIGFSAVGSPLGKFPLTGDFQEQLDGLSRALEFAQILDAPYIRMFSFYPPEGEDAAAHRTQVLDWFARMVEAVEPTPTRLAHENERGIYGETGQRVLDLISSIGSPSLTCTFDFSNFVQAGQRTWECWLKLKPYLGYFHVKDALPDGTVVPAGQGAGEMARILTDAFAGGNACFLTLEPHLKPVPGLPHQSKAKRFGTAASALRELLAGIPGSAAVLGER